MDNGNDDPSLFLICKREREQHNTTRSIVAVMSVCELPLQNKVQVENRRTFLYYIMIINRTMKPPNKNLLYNKPTAVSIFWVKENKKKGPANNSRDITDMRTWPVMQIIHATTIDMAFFVNYFMSNDVFI